MIWAPPKGSGHCSEATLLLHIQICSSVQVVSIARLVLFVLGTWQSFRDSKLLGSSVSSGLHSPIASPTLSSWYQASSLFMTPSILCLQLLPRLYLHQWPLLTLQSDQLQLLYMTQPSLLNHYYPGDSYTLLLCLAASTRYIQPWPPMVHSSVCWPGGIVTFQISLQWFWYLLNGQ